MYNDHNKKCVTREISHHDFLKNASVRLKTVFEIPFLGSGGETDTHPRKHSSQYSRRNGTEPAFFRLDLKMSCQVLNNYLLIALIMTRSLDLQMNNFHQMFRVL